MLSSQQRIPAGLARRLILIMIDHALIMTLTSLEVDLIKRP
jgi:hypothetical protein